MSFQGDVGGIGLADLLQSLARGRDGVLTLNAKAGLRSTLGIVDGQVHLLPDAEEDPEIWRGRARQAWIKDPDFHIDSLRMNEIARAQRIETLYAMLDSEGVHFRFNPGPVPKASEGTHSIQPGESGAPAAGTRKDSIFVAPASIEGLLLEYARLKDEGMGAGPWQFLSQHLVLRKTQDERSSKEVPKFFEQCDGDSNLIELADRLGWPLREVKITALTMLARGRLRVAVPGELLLLAQSELVQTNSERAASRLVCWIDFSPPGPLSPDDAEVLATEWEAQRLQPALSRMPLDASRTLVQRLSRTINQPLRTMEHWAELARIAEHDTLVDLHLLVAQIRAPSELNLPSFKGLLEVARGFCDAGHGVRAAAILRVAAGRQPTHIDERLALGTAMLAAGQSSEAAPWILEACRTLLEAGACERVLAPLRQLTEFEPLNREARRLFSRARALSVRRSLVKKNSLVTIAVLLAISVGALVQYRSEHTRKQRIAEIEALMEQPAEALLLCDQYFPGEAAAQVASLRATIVQHKRERENELRSAWTDRYKEAQLECTIGDPLLGLERALELPPPPSEIETSEPWPLSSDLFNGVVARVENALAELGPTVEDTPAQIRAEEHVLALIHDLEGKLAGRELDASAKEFARQLQVLGKRTTERGEARAAARSDRQRKDNLAKQDMLLAAARAHAQAGDHKRALQAYQSLLESDTTGRLKDLLLKEVTASQKKQQALEKARALCLAGDHAAARTLLTGSLENAGEYLMPWKVESSPSGARARSSDGSVHTTPFTLETTLNESVEIDLELEGYDPRHLKVREPANQFVYLSKQPERAWSASGRVDALPVAVGDDHVLADRNGNVTRLTAGEPGWQKKLSTLGGIARAPVFLPRRAGFLLVLSEDGDAWVLDAHSGESSGPWNRGVAPLAGPFVVEDSVLVRFRDGSVWRWRDQVTPEPVDDAQATALLAPFLARGLERENQLGLTAGFAVVRRGSAEKNRLESPWNDLVVEIANGRYSLSTKNAGGTSFTIDVRGEWSYVAFESPTARAARGRLWISDGAGLRSFLP